MTKTIFIVIAIFGSLSNAVFARPPKVTEPLFQGQPDDNFVEWVVERIGFPEILDAPAMTDVEPFWAHFKVSETGRIIDVRDSRVSCSQFEFLLRTIIEKSPEWTPAYRRKTPQLIGYNLFVRPAERTLQLLKVDECEQVMPTFQGGGVMEFRDWVTDNLRYPRDLFNSKIEGRVAVSFAIERDGSITFKELLDATSREMVQEVIRVLLSSPKWTPGSLEGIPASVSYVLPVAFEMRPD